MVTHSHSPVEVLQDSPATLQVTPLQRVTHLREASHFFPAGQEFGAAVQTHWPVKVSQLSPAAQVTPRHFGSQRFTTLQVSFAEQEVGVQAHNPLSGSQLSPGAQVTVPHLFTQRFDAGSQAAGEAHEPALQAQSPVRGAQLSPPAQVTLAHLFTHRWLVGSQAAPARQEVGSQEQRPVVGSQRSPGWQPAMVQSVLQRLVGSQNLSVGQETEVHWQTPVPALQVSPRAQPALAHLFSHRKVAALQVAGAVQEPGWQRHLPEESQVSPVRQVSLQATPASGPAVAASGPSDDGVEGMVFPPQAAKESSSSEAAMARVMGFSGSSGTEDRRM